MDQPEKEDIIVNTFITVNDSPENLYNCWRDMRNFVAILDFPESVIKIDQNRFRATTVIKNLNEQLSWELEIIEENPGHYYSWHSCANPDILHEGSVRFISKEMAKTEIRLQFRLFFPLLEDSKPYMMGPQFKSSIEESLRRFKQAWEAKEFVLSKENLTEFPDNLNSAKPTPKKFETEKKKGDIQKNISPDPYLH